MLWADGGRKGTTAVQPLQGPDRIARGMIGFLAKYPRPITGYRIDIQEQPIFVSELDGQPLGVVTLGVFEGRIRDIRIIGDPEKLQRLTALWSDLVASGRAKPVSESIKGTAPSV